jgi:uncharacterized protein YraI
MSQALPTGFAGTSGPIRRGRGTFRLLALLSLFTMLCGGIALTPSAALASSTTTTDDLNLRTGPGLDYDVITVMPAGSAVEVTGDPQNGFYPVSYGGTNGYASGDYLAINGDGGGGTASGTGLARVIDGALNLRSGPSTDSSIITVMPGDAQVTLNGTENNGFLAITYNGTDGWAYAQYLSTSGSADTGGDSADAGPTGTAWVIDGTLNLRSGPSTDNSILTVMPGDAQVTMTGQSSNGFYSVSYNGTDGWAYAQYLSTTQPSDKSADSGSASGAGSKDDIVSIIYAAADKYGQPRADMLRVAECESNLDPNAVNPVSGTSGLFQFMPSTFASTPYAGDSIFDPWASANAAGWMWSVGRRGEWACQ